MANRQWSLEEKRRAVERMKICGHDKLAGELGIERRQLYRWRAQLKRLDQGLNTVRGKKRDLKQENAHLKQMLAERELEIEFFKGALRRIEARRRQNDGSGGTAFTNKCE